MIMIIHSFPFFSAWHGKRSVKSNSLIAIFIKKSLFHRHTLKGIPYHTRPYKTIEFHNRPYQAIQDRKNFPLVFLHVGKKSFCSRFISVIIKSLMLVRRALNSTIPSTATRDPFGEPCNACFLHYIKPAIFWMEKVFHSINKKGETWLENARRTTLRHIFIGVCPLNYIKQYL